MDKTFAKHSITAELAQQLIDSAVAKANSLGVPQIVAVLDESGHLKAFCRMDGAPLISIEVCQNKAYTALLGAPSHEFYNRIKDNPALAAGLPNLARIAPFGGGYPVRIDGTVVGANGVSGGSVEQDMACAEAALADLAQL